MILPHACLFSLKFQPVTYHGRYPSVSMFCSGHMHSLTWGALKSRAAVATSAPLLQRTSSLTGYLRVFA